jgi:hypothetical protein
MMLKQEVCMQAGCLLQAKWKRQNMVPEFSKLTSTPAESKTEGLKAYLAVC